MADFVGNREEFASIRTDIGVDGDKPSRCSLWADEQALTIPKDFFLHFDFESPSDVENVGDLVVAASLSEQTISVDILAPVLPPRKQSCQQVQLWAWPAALAQLVASLAFRRKAVVPYASRQGRVAR